MIELSLSLSLSVGSFPRLNRDSRRFRHVTFSFISPKSLRYARVAESRDHRDDLLRARRSASCSDIRAAFSADRIFEHRNSGWKRCHGNIRRIIHRARCASVHGGEELCRGAPREVTPRGGHTVTVGYFLLLVLPLSAPHEFVTRARARAAILRDRVADNFRAASLENYRPRVARPRRGRVLGLPG